MLSLDEINKTILDLEAHDTTYATCEKLAWLYIVRDHLTHQTNNYITENKSVPEMPGSAFLEASSNKDICALLEILDEHMQVIELLYPKEYHAVIDKINEL